MIERSRASIGLLRRMGPALCGAALLWLPVACEDDGEEIESGWDSEGTTGGGWGPSDAAPPPTGGAATAAPAAGAEPVIPDSIPIPDSSERVEAVVSIDGNAVTRRIESGVLSVAGY